jgi:hypothetical protein
MQYSTGRVYNGAQVLNITVERETVDEFGTLDIVATFDDASRGISGRVDVLAFAPDDIGPAVLMAYDAGRYELI